MSLGLEHSAIQRSLEGLAFRISVAAKTKANAGNAYALAETVQQYQIDFNGSVGPVGTFEEVQVPFHEKFYIAPGQRNSNHEEPHFTYGVVLDLHSQDMFISAYVIDWDTDEQGNFTAATVRVGLYNPALVTSKRFSGRIHASFQGFSAPSDDVPEDDGAMQ